MDTSTKLSSRPILAVVDLQPHSRQVLEHALSLAIEQNRPLLVLHVVHETAQSSGFYYRNNNLSYVLPMEDIAKRLLQKLVDEMVSRHTNDSSKPEIGLRVVQGVPASRIVEIAEKEDAERIVMVSNARKALGRFWHGSVTQEVLRHTNRNLVVLREEPDFNAFAGPATRAMPTQFAS